MNPLEIKIKKKNQMIEENNKRCNFCLSQHLCTNKEKFKLMPFCPDYVYNNKFDYKAAKKVKLLEVLHSRNEMRIKKRMSAASAAAPPPEDDFQLFVKECEGYTRRCEICEYTRVCKIKDRHYFSKCNEFIPVKNFIELKRKVNKMDDENSSIRTVKLTYEEFCKIKKCRYDRQCIIDIACRKLGLKRDDIDDIDWNYSLKFDVYLK